LNDLAAAESAVRVKAERYGARRLERELRARGFSRETVARVLASRDPDLEETALRRGLERIWKFHARLSPPLRRRRAIESLARRGFSPEKVSEMIERFQRTDESQRGSRTVS